MFRVDIVAEAREEIRNLFKSDEVQARRIYAVISDLNKNCEDIHDITGQGFECEDFNVVIFEHMQRKQLRNVWRLKVFDFSKRGNKFFLGNRAIYAPDYQRNTIHILGLMERDVNYEKDKKFVSEIIRRYDNLGLPRLPRG